MNAHSDLVRDFKLETQFHPKYTCHRYDESDLASGTRLVIRQEYWKRQTCIGSGGYGSVWLERCFKGEKEQTVRAVKEIHKQKSVKPDTYYRELEAIAKFSNARYVRCFVRSFGWFEDEDRLLISMEYFPHGDLHEYLYKHLPEAEALSEAEAQVVIYQLLEGLIFLHQNGFAHRDLKPSNVLINSKPPKSWWVKIGDFGISKRVSGCVGSVSSVKGTKPFMAPELNGYIKQSDRYVDNLLAASCAADIWSLGEIAFQLLTKQATFQDFDSLGEFCRHESSFPVAMLTAHHVAPEGCEFIELLMKPAPKQRPTAQQALSHVWLAALKAPVPRVLSMVSEAQACTGTSTANNALDGSSNVSRDIINDNDLPLPDPSGTWSTVSTTNRFPQPTSYAAGTILDGQTQLAVVPSSGGSTPRADESHFVTALTAMRTTLVSSAQDGETKVKKLDSIIPQEQPRSIRSATPITQRQTTGVDSKKRQQDRDALLALAHRNFGATTPEPEAGVLREPGGVSSAQSERWESLAQKRAEHENDERTLPAGKVHIGGGESIDQTEFDAIAGARVQPTLDDITRKAYEQRAKDLSGERMPRFANWHVGGSLNLDRHVPSTEVKFATDHPRPAGPSEVTLTPKTQYVLQKAKRYLYFPVWKEHCLTFDGDGNLKISGKDGADVRPNLPCRWIISVDWLGPDKKDQFRVTEEIGYYNRPSMLFKASSEEHAEVCIRLFLEAQSLSKTVFDRFLRDQKQKLEIEEERDGKGTQRRDGKMKSTTPRPQKYSGA